MSDQPNQPIQLSPEEKMLQLRGEAALRKAMESRGQTPSSIVGPDGAPIAASGPVQADELAARRVMVEQEARAKQETQAKIDAHVAKMRASAKEEHDLALQDAAKISRMCPDLDRCFQTILTSYRVIFWAKMEALLLHPEMTEKILYHVERQLMSAVYGGGGIRADTLPHELRRTVTEFVQERNRIHEDYWRARRNRLQPVFDRLKKENRVAFSVPEGMEQAFDFGKLGKLVWGQVVAVYGLQTAITMLFDQVAEAHERRDDGVVLRMKPLAEGPGILSTSLFKFYEVMDEVTEGKVSLLLIPDYAQLIRDPQGQPVRTPSARGRVLSALRQAADERGLVILAGDPTDNQFITGTEYQGIPSVRVTLHLNDLKDGKPALRVG